MRSLLILTLLITTAFGGEIEKEKEQPPCQDCIPVENPNPPIAEYECVNGRFKLVRKAKNLTPQEEKEIHQTEGAPCKSK